MEDIHKMKVADLKKELKDRGLPITGNKTELIERLEEALQNAPEDWAEGNDDFDEDEILADEPEEKPKSAGKRAAATKRTAETPSKTGKAKVAKTAAAANGVDKSATTAAQKKDADEAAKALQARAERFGVQSDDAKKAARAERFGVSNGDSKDVPVDVDVLKARAARFGEVTSKVLSKSTPPVDIDVLKARAERFGEVTSKSLVKLDSEEKKKAREERFQGESQTEEESDTKTESAPTVINGKTVITAPGSDSSAEVAKKKRAERFAAA